MDYRNIAATEVTECATRLLTKVQLEHIPQQRDPMQLSGGEQQRLAFAATLAQDAPVLVLDEATSQLDRSAREAFLPVLTGSQGKTIIAIDHNLECHLPHLDRIIILGLGGEVLWDDDKPPRDARSYGIRKPGSTRDLPRINLPLGDALLDLGFAKLPLGSVVAVVAPNGSGKSTLLRALTKEKRFLKAGIAWLPQRGSHFLLRGTVAEELSRGFTAEDAGLAGMIADHPLSLSGGQRQRLALARALGGFSGRLALLDEPSYSQDLTGTLQVMKMIAMDSKQRVTLMATHDELLIRTLAAHVISLENGKINQIRELETEIERGEGRTGAESFRIHWHCCSPRLLPSSGCCRRLVELPVNDHRAMPHFRRMSRFATILADFGRDLFSFWVHLFQLPALARFPACLYFGAAPYRGDAATLRGIQLDSLGGSGRYLDQSIQGALSGGGRHLIGWQVCCCDEAGVLQYANPTKSGSQGKSANSTAAQPQISHPVAGRFFSARRHHSIGTGKPQLCLGQHPNDAL